MSVVREAETRSVKALHGLSRSLVHNMVQGVSEGFTKQLEIEGVGFQGRRPGSDLNLSSAFPIRFHFRFQRTSRSRSRKTRRSRSRASTRNWSARWRRTSAAFTRRSLTRAKAFATRANRFVARKARPFNNYGDRFARQRGSAFIKRISENVAGTAERPRLSVHFSGKHVYAQVIDDDSGQDARSRIDRGGSLLGKDKAGANRPRQNKSAKRSRNVLAKKVERVVFDRGGFLYHGKVKALADAAREGGLKF